MQLPPWGPLGPQRFSGLLMLVMQLRGSLANCTFPAAVQGAVLKLEFQGIKYFPVGSIVKYECIQGLKHDPATKNSIHCNANSMWSQPEILCRASCPLPPKVGLAVLKMEFQGKEYFPVGSIVKYGCIHGFKHDPATKNSVQCNADLRWSQPEKFCKESCFDPPILSEAILQEEFKRLKYFPLGTVVKYDCFLGFQRVPGTENSLQCNLGYKWSFESFCKVIECDDPVIEHGVKLTGFSQRHVYGNKIAFECNIGYFMIGSYLIQCGDNNMWNPKVPSCEKITAKLCGAPLVPSGSVHPLEPRYKVGTYVVIECNPQYSFPDETMEMTTICQGYNLWNPSAQPCIFRTSPDTSVLTIHNGRIIHGEKKKYKPGDNVTIKCFAGYMLQGPSVIRYIGGKKWSPRIPYCSLSFIFILLIAAIIFCVLLVLAKRLYEKYSEQNGSTLWI